MKIRVCYSELHSAPGYQNQRAEAELEVEVNDGNLEKAYANAWDIVKKQVRKQLGNGDNEFLF